MMTEDLDIAQASEEIEKQKELAKAQVDVSQATAQQSKYSSYTASSTTTNNNLQKHGSSSANTADDFFSSVANSSSNKSQGGGYSAKGGGRNASAYEQGTAQERFKNAKGISSDQFFGRDKVEEPDHEKQAQLQRFAGAKSISSDAYYGKEDTSLSNNNGKRGGGGDDHGGSAADFFAEISSKVTQDLKNVVVQAKQTLERYQNR
jgi:ADP-ribosylation factor GTPase-activating protein 2/3